MSVLTAHAVLVDLQARRASPVQTVSLAQPAVTENLVVPDTLEMRASLENQELQARPVSKAVQERTESRDKKDPQATKESLDLQAKRDLKGTLVRMVNVGTMVLQDRPVHLAQLVLQELKDSRECKARLENQERMPNIVLVQTEVLELIRTLAMDRLPKRLMPLLPLSPLTIHLLPPPLTTILHRL